MKQTQQVDRIRTTVSLTCLLDRNLEAFCLKEKKGKSEVVEEALTLYLSQNGVITDQEPSIEWK